MSLIEHFIIVGATCSARGCDAEIRPPELATYPNEVRNARDLIRSIGEPLGWSYWGGRSARAYCPQHGPRPASVARGRMHRIW
jgi:hypothetical protein